MKACFVAIVVAVIWISSAGAADTNCQAAPQAGITADSFDNTKASEAINQVLSVWHSSRPDAGVRRDVRLLDTVLKSNRLTLNFSPELLDYRVGSAEFEEMLRQIHFAASEALESDLRNIDFFVLIDGVPLNELFEEVEQPVDAQNFVSPARTGDFTLQSISGRRITISPGHGYYWTGSTWVLQRSYWWGIVEDFVNPDIAIYLNSALVAAGADVRPTRNLNKSAGNGESGHPKWQEAARYHLKAIGVDSTVWNEPGFTHVEQDIRCRPRYANSVGAEIVVSIHNNGAAGTGTETWYDTANGYQVESKRLADILQSRIVNAIRSGYNSSWTDRGVKGSNGGYGENRLATRPSVILEIAFMDRQIPDNAALQNETFKSLVATAIKDGMLEYFGSTVTVPTVSAKPAASITASSARIWGRIVSDGGAPILERRFEWGQSGTWTSWTSNVTVSGSDFYYDLTGLSPNTGYQFRAWAKNSTGWAYSAAAYFTTTGTDTTPPTVSAFSATPSSVTLGNAFAISYTVSDAGGSGLKQVELWRAPDNSNSPGSWSPVSGKINSHSGNGPVSGSFSDAPGTAGTYWYGVHVVDNAGNWNDERNSNTGSLPGIFGPIKVTVTTVTPPTAYAASGVTSSGFTANWSSASGATGYRLDVSTSSAFSSYVVGYQNLDVGNVVSRSVSGLNAGVTYYYRVRAYNAGGTSGNSGTIEADSRWPILGDVNADCAVNILDLIFIRGRMNQSTATADNWKADVNDDGRINILDLIYVRNKLNTRCQRKAVRRLRRLRRSRRGFSPLPLHLCNLRNLWILFFLTSRFPPPNSPGNPLPE